MTLFTYGAKPTRVLASARLNSREAAKKITAGIARGHVRGRCRLFQEVVVKNRVKTASPNNAKGHDGYFLRGTLSDVFGLLQMACDAATRHNLLKVPRNFGFRTDFGFEVILSGGSDSSENPIFHY